jgi:hypothetical protein
MKTRFCWQDAQFYRDGIMKLPEYGQKCVRTAEVRSNCVNLQDKVQEKYQLLFHLFLVWRERLWSITFQFTFIHKYICMARVTDTCNLMKCVPVAYKCNWYSGFCLPCYIDIQCIVRLHIFVSYIFW